MFILNESNFLALQCSWSCRSHTWLLSARAPIAETKFQMKSVLMRNKSLPFALNKKQLCDGKQFIKTRSDKTTLGAQNALCSR